MIEPARARFYRLIFGLAAAYNVAFGLWAALWPLAFFRLFELEPPRYPSIWSCLGMVVGVYGLLYAYATIRLDRALPIVAIGLAGKILGPIGWLLSPEWPARTFTLITFNDIVWWVPFGMFLLEGRAVAGVIRRAAPFICGACNALGGLALLLILKPGSEVEPDLAKRAAYISEHPVLWRLGWLTWYASALSLLGFYAWWGTKLPRPGWGLAAWGVAAAGICCDLTAESLFIGWLPDRIESIQRAGTLLTGAAANGLYTVAGIMLTAATPSMPLRPLAWVIWTFGLGLTASALAGSVAGMVVTTGGLMALFCPWTWLMGWKLK
jgi:hypothetical protein